MLWKQWITHERISWWSSTYGKSLIIHLRDFHKKKKKKTDLVNQAVINNWTAQFLEKLIQSFNFIDWNCKVTNKKKQTFKLINSKTEKFENPLIQNCKQCSNTHWTWNERERKKKKNPHRDSRARRFRSAWWHERGDMLRKSKHCPTEEMKRSIMAKKGMKTAQSCSPTLRELDLCITKTRPTTLPNF